jgi:hypothetical protein
MEPARRRVSRSTQQVWQRAGPCRPCEAIRGLLYRSAIGGGPQERRAVGSSDRARANRGATPIAATTTNDVSFFKHYRKVEHREGPPTRALASVKKSIYSLIDLREIPLGCNRRYLAHLSALDYFSAGVRALSRLIKPHEVDGKTVKGINFFDPGDNALLNALHPCPALSITTRC